MKILMVLGCLFSILSADNIALIKQYIQNAYEQKYKPYEISISKISLSLPPKISINDYKINSIDLSNNFLSKKEGLIILDASYHNALLKLPLQYAIQANIQVYKSNTTIKTSEDITSENTTKDTIVFEKISSIPITKNQINTLSAKSYIPPNTIITLDKTQPKILIRKNDIFTGVIKDKNINLETTLLAKQNGAKGEIINAINPETKKMLRVKVIDTNKGEIL